MYQTSDGPDTSMYPSLYCASAPSTMDYMYNLAVNCQKNFLSIDGIKMEDLENISVDTNQKWTRTPINEIGLTDQNLTKRYCRYPGTPILLADDQGNFWLNIIYWSHHVKQIIGFCVPVNATDGSLSGDTVQPQDLIMIDRNLGEIVVPGNPTNGALTTDSANINNG